MVYFSRCGVIFRSAQAASEKPLVRHSFLNGRVAQLAEHSALNRQVVGSIPTASTSLRQTFSSRRSLATLGISARGSDAAKAPQLVGDLTAGDPPVPIPNTEVKPRRADCTARESVWESRSLPALIRARLRNQSGSFLFV